MENIDYAQLLNGSEIQGEGDQAALNSILKGFLEIGDIQKAADVDGDGQVSEAEAKDYISSIIGKDGDAASLSMADIDAVIEEMGIDLEQIAEESIEEVLKEEEEEPLEEIKDEIEEAKEAKEAEAAEKAQAAQSAAPSGGAGSAGGGGGVSGGSTPSVEKATGLDAMSLEELESEKKTREAEMQEKQDAVDAVYNGENPAVKEAQEELDKAEEEYKEAVKNDDKIPDELKTKQAKNLEDIDKNQADLDKKGVEINDKECEISNQENTVTSCESELSSLEGSLSSLPSPSGKEEDKEKDAEIAEKKASIEKQISEKKEELQTAKDELQTKKDELDKLNEDKTKLETQKEKLEKAREEIEKEIEKNCSEETKQAMQAYNEAKTNVESVKEKELSTAKADLETSKASVKEIDQKITEVKNKELERENSVNSSNLPDGFFNKDGILAGQEKLVAEVAEKYGLEPEFLAAIIGLESGYGTSALAKSNNNFGGVSGSGDAGSTTRASDGHKFAKYSSVEAGLDAMAKNLASYNTRFSDVKSVDINNVAAIGGHYCVGGDWANKVTSIYNRIKSMQG